MLNDFSTVELSEHKAEAFSEPSQPATARAPDAGQIPNMDDILSDDDFAKQLEAGMADLLGEIENSVSSIARLESLGEGFGQLT